MVLLAGAARDGAWAYLWYSLLREYGASIPHAQLRWDADLLFWSQWDRPEGIPLRLPPSPGIPSPKAFSLAIAAILVPPALLLPPPVPPLRSPSNLPRNAPLNANPHQSSGSNSSRQQDSRPLNQEGGSMNQAAVGVGQGGTMQAQAQSMHAASKSSGMARPPVAYARQEVLRTATLKPDAVTYFGMNGTNHDDLAESAQFRPPTSNATGSKATAPHGDQADSPQIAIAGPSSSTGNSNQSRNMGRMQTSQPQPRHPTTIGQNALPAGRVATTNNNPPPPNLSRPPPNQNPQPNASSVSSHNFTLAPWAQTFREKHQQLRLELPAKRRGREQRVPAMHANPTTDSNPSAPETGSPPAKRIKRETPEDEGEM